MNICGYLASYMHVSPYVFLKFFNHGAIVEEWPVEAAKKGILSFFFSSLEASAFFLVRPRCGVSSD